MEKIGVEALKVYTYMHFNNCGTCITVQDTMHTINILVS